MAFAAAAVSVGATGCWMAAAQFAPLAAQAAEYVGGTALELTSGIGATETAESKAAKEEAAERASAMNSGDACNQLEVEVPDVIELRRSAAGAPEYRELQISDTLAERQWLPLADSETTPEGWRPAVNFLQMNFTPPLGAVVPESASSFLAYTPSKVITAADGDRLTAMSSNFGQPVGTFTWNGNYYHYVVTSTLPCFPPPPERIAEDAPAHPGF
ncbi:hypothetical protein [Candidatus Binatus sp.]|uniref:hypothetical protein n=1 Tax=Candidatus Binatus sp. TaxID=2811406 RepID=UPI003BAFA068